ncbi:MAG: ATP-binding cassette domain-containing protein [Pseudomonadota bacterium]
MIVAQQLNKRFKQIQAVKDVSFTAPDGRITALLGPNGAGKSTTLRMLASVVTPDGGSAQVDGQDVVQARMAVRRSIGVLPHNSGLYGRLTGIENIRYFGRLQGMSAAALESRIEALIQQLDMADFAHRRTAGFSQGQKVKVAVARALVHNPQNIMLDEPTNGLDVMATRALRDIIRNLQQAGKCVVFSSHIMQEVDALCDSVVVIGQGEVRFDGSIEQMRQHAGTQDLEEAFIRMAGIQTDAAGDSK